MPWTIENGNPKNIIIPHTQKALELLDEGETDYNITSIFRLTEPEYDALLDLFIKFNHTFQLMIDDYETDCILADDIGKAIEIVQNFTPENDSEDYRRGVAKVMQALECAKQYGSMAMFAF